MRLAPLAPERFALQVTIDKTTHDLLQHAQEMLSHQIPNGDLAAVLRRVLETAIPRLERQQFAATDAPRTRRDRPIRNPRHVPANVRREVWKRDGYRCTFVGESGRRCESRKFLELDHILPVARGGESTLSNLRLRCRAHNQLEAERTFGSEFMKQRREKSIP